MKRRYKKNQFREKAKKQRRTLAVALIFSFLVLGGLSAFVLADDGVDKVTVTADSGDTLWDICEQYKPDNMDLRDFIAKVKYKNHIRDSALSIGQEIIIPLR